MNGTAGNRFDDQDALTDEMISRDNKTWSKGRLRRQKFISTLRGNPQPSRKKLFSEIHMNEDLKVYNTEVHGKAILCAKVYNPAIFFVKKENTTWDKLSGVQRLEIEDHEGILSTVPKQLISALNGLESLTINWTKIRSLPDRLFQQPLKSLYLQRNQMRLLTGIEQAAATLTILDVSHNCINTLPKSFGLLVNLVTLNVSGNALRELPTSIGSLERLKSLDVSSNKLRSLPVSIGDAIELRILDVCNNQLVVLPDSITSLLNLEDLRARGNRLSSLPSSFDRLVRLNTLLLRGNTFAEVPPVLSSLTSLTSLNMRDNSIVKMLQPIQSLRQLVLDNNQLTTIDDGILGCVNLQMLSLQHNRLSKIPPEIVKLRSLRSLLLSENGITKFPIKLTQLSHLRHIGLRSTLIETVPVQITTMTELTGVELDDCDQLHHEIRLAYKEGGWPRVVEFLKSSDQEQLTASSEDCNDRKQMMKGLSLPLSDPKSRNTIYPNEDLKLNKLQISSRNSVMPEFESDEDLDWQIPGSSSPSAAITGLSRMTMMPHEFDDGAQQHNNGGVKSRRQQAGLSIVVGRTSPTTQLLADDGSGTASPKSINLASRNTMYPNMDDEDDPNGVICTLNEFGDLLSASTDTTLSRAAATDGTTFVPGSASAGELENGNFDEDDFSHLYATVTKKAQNADRAVTSKNKQPATKKAGVRFAE